MAKLKLWNTCTKIWDRVSVLMAQGGAWHTVRFTTLGKQPAKSDAMQMRIVLATTAQLMELGASTSTILKSSPLTMTGNGASKQAMLHRLLTWMAQKAGPVGENPQIVIQGGLIIMDIVIFFERI